jgi:glutathione peroxidase
LQKYCPSPWEMFKPVQVLNYQGISKHDIRWNFEKFLIDTEGRPVMRYSEKFLPEEIEEDIKQLLIMSESIEKH